MQCFFIFGYRRTLSNVPLIFEIVAADCIRILGWLGSTSCSFSSSTNSAFYSEFSLFVILAYVFNGSHFSFSPSDR